MQFSGFLDSLQIDCRHRDLLHLCLAPPCPLSAWPNATISARITCRRQRSCPRVVRDSIAARTPPSAVRRICIDGSDDSRSLRNPLSSKRATDREVRKQEQVKQRSKWVPLVTKSEMEALTRFIINTHPTFGAPESDPYFQDINDRHAISVDNYAKYVSGDGFDVQIVAESGRRCSVHIFMPDGSEAEDLFDSAIGIGYRAGFNDYQEVIDQALAITSAAWACGELGIAQAQLAYVHILMGRLFEALKQSHDQVEGARVDQAKLTRSPQGTER